MLEITIDKINRREEPYQLFLDSIKDQAGKTKNKTPTIVGTTSNSETIY